ncbi:YqhR family membrane protein [Massilibacterium senegalense]|uniref:YqhR family membrane protein n=1 Tax=Massilibacterium senegalense TaxID=1632858 RepID=UPI0007843786|nr:YqhR family membrane protein [Massilibacterium senegalense]
MNQHSKQSVLITSLFGGIFFSFLGYVVYFLNFTDLHPAYMLHFFSKAAWTKGALGEVMGIISIGFLSIPIGYLYERIVPPNASIAIGIVLGFLLWLFVFFVLYRFFDSFKSVTELGVRTNITSICLYVLYSVFLGTSFSYAKRKEQGS